MRETIDVGQFEDGENSSACRRGGVELCRVAGGGGAVRVTPAGGGQCAIAQKTGQPCGKCHTASPPALNSYGKSYKSKAK